MLRFKMKTNIVKFLACLLGSIALTLIVFADFNPNGGENGEFWTQNTTQTVRWDTSYFHNYVNIYLWNMTSATFTTIDTNIEASLGKYNWTIPQSCLPDFNYRIKVQQADSLAVYQFSETFFPVYQGSAPHHSSVTEETENGIDLRVVPNPASDVFRLKFSSPSAASVQINIFDLLGNKVLSQTEQCSEGTNEKNINCESLPSGWYYVKINLNENVETMPLVLVR